MAQEYIEVMKENSLGEIHINKSVIEEIARINIGEIKGVHIVSGSFKKGVNCFISKEGLIKVECEIKYNYGINAERTSRQIQDKVFKAVKQQCDVAIDQIDVNVVGFQFNS